MMPGLIKPQVMIALKKFSGLETLLLPCLHTSVTRNRTFFSFRSGKIFEMLLVQTNNWDQSEIHCILNNCRWNIFLYIKLLWIFLNHTKQAVQSEEISYRYKHRHLWLLYVLAWRAHSEYWRLRNRGCSIWQKKLEAFLFYSNLCIRDKYQRKGKGEGEKTRSFWKSLLNTTQRLKKPLADL